LSLTPRQREVVKLLCSGLQTKQIARQLGITPAVVSNHLLAVRQQNGLRNIAQLGMAVERENVFGAETDRDSVAYPARPAPGSQTSATRLNKTPVGDVPTGVLEVRSKHNNQLNG
jgi:DNA-binding CsgD family transcriptional regulator